MKAGVIVKICRVIILLLCLVFLLPGCKAPANVPETTTEEIAGSTTDILDASTEPETTMPNTTEPAPTAPQPVTYTLSFAGDCTLGTDSKYYSYNTAFVHVVGENYGYPFENVYDIFAGDDFTLVNLEGVLSDTGVPQEDKLFTFRGPESYARILTSGSVEGVVLANNHTYDFGQTGYRNTKAALEQENVVYAEAKKPAIYRTESGLTIGIYAVAFYAETSAIKNGIAQLREQGAEIVIFSMHAGVEGSYRVTDQQKFLAHTAIDAGADIVFGHHSHVLQPIEYYKEGVIYYSLGNFAFGGNSNPPDKDTAIIQQTVIREPDGTVHLGQTIRLACRLSSVTNCNDYRPTPHEEGSKEQERALSKLNGTFTGADLVVIRPTTEPETTVGETEPIITEPETPENTEPAATEPPATQPSATEAPATEIQTLPPQETEPSAEDPK